MNILQAIEEIGRTKDIDISAVIKATEEAFAAAARKFYKTREDFVAKLDRASGQIEVFVKKIAVENVGDPTTETTLEDAKKHDKNAVVGSEVLIPLAVSVKKTVVKKVEDPALEIAPEDAKKHDKNAVVGSEVLIPRSSEDFGRIAAQTVKQVIYQRVREAERYTVYERYIGEKEKLLSGIVRRIEHNNIIITVGKTEAILPKRFQIKGENYSPGDRIRAVIVDVDRAAKDYQIVASRTDATLISCLFELEVPEIKEGIVQIKGVSREPGERAKIAVASSEPDIDPIGTCVGMKGYRVQNITKELGNEKIDIVPFSDDIATYIKNALAPARITKITILNRGKKEAEVVVPNDQLSLAIGRGGINVRLAANLVGWHIDIKSADEKKKEVAKHIEEIVAIPDELDAISGMKASLLKALKEAGITTVTELANASLETLLAVPGVGKKSAERLQNTAREITAIKQKAQKATEESVKE